MEALLNFWKDHIWEYLKDFGLIDAIDILVLALVLFFAYKFLRDRRAGKLIIGLGFVSLVLIVSSFIGMNAVNYILRHFYQIGLLALIIVFQPELRTALEKVGNTPISGFREIVSDSRDMKAVLSDIEAICDAVSDMSRTKTGALIVIERQTKLGEYIKSGVTVNAQLSSFLLRNIFFNKAPLHDGAVIIRNYRVFAAGCFLPLSTKDDIVKSLGTRHRAAIGLSEISDAIVIVVSEETGTISVAKDGELKRDYNYGTLKQELLALLVQNNRHHAQRRQSDTDGKGNEK